MNQSDDNYMSGADVARYLDVSPASISQRVLRNTIPYRKVDGRTLFVKEDVDQWLDAIGKLQTLVGKQN